MKKMISIIVSLVLALSCLMAITPVTAMAEDVAAATTNLFVNGGFEDGFNGWSNSFQTSTGNWYEASYEIVDTEKHSGNASLYREVTVSRDYDHYIHQKLTLKPFTNYNFSFYVKGKPDYLRTYMSYNLSNIADIDHALFFEQASYNTNEWKEVKYSFKTNENTEYLFVLYYFCQGSAYFDDFCLEEVVPESDVPVPDTGLVVNGTFEDGFDGWTKTNYGGYSPLNASVSSEEAYSGFNSLYFVNNTSASLYNRALYQDLTLEANAKYKISFYSKGNLGYGWLRVTDKSNETPWNANGNEVFNKQLSDDNGSWTRYSFFFNTDDRTDYRLALAFVGTLVDFYIDDITLVKYDNLVVNGDFEDGFSGWSKVKWATWATDAPANVTSDQANSGVNSLYYTNGTSASLSNRAVVQDIKLEANTKYKLSFYAKGHLGWGRVRVIDKDCAEPWNGDATEIFNKQYSDETAEWTKYSAYFYTDDRTEYKLSLAFAGTAVNVYFDDFSIVKADGIINNGGFEDGMDEWVTTNSPEVEVDSYEKHSGNNSLYNYVTGDNSKYNRTVSQDIKLKPYTEYTIKMWIKGNPGWGRFYIQDDLSLATYNHDSTLLNKQLTDSYECEEWTEVTETFVTSDKTDARLVFYFSSIATDINIDDIEIKATGKVIGDFSGEGTVTSDDAVTMKKFILGADSGLEDTAILDITCDGKVDIVDFIRLKKILASLA